MVCASTSSCGEKDDSDMMSSGSVRVSVASGRGVAPKLKSAVFKIQRFTFEFNHPQEQVEVI